MINFKDYLAIARPGHWIKNIFILPGTAFAALLTGTPVGHFKNLLLIGFISTCFATSANYIINEWLDAETDRFHPKKKNRPFVTGDIKIEIAIIEYLALATLSLLLAMYISWYFTVAIAILMLMGIIYNVPPFRTKDSLYIDVLTESLNNPVRLLIGWFVVTDLFLPPSSLVFGYWMGGAFLMAVKRYAEYRFIGNPDTATLYRKSFRYYTEERLLISSFFYGICAAFFTGVFLIKYKIELVLSLPFFAVLFTWYLHIGMKPDSTVQNPERLYREKGFIAYVAFLVILIGALLLLDINWLHWLLENTFVSVGANP